MGVWGRNNAEENNSMADHQKAPESWEDGRVFGKSRCTYLLRKDNSQNHGNKQTNEEEKKQQNKSN